MRLHADRIEDVVQRRANPFRDVGPALFALHHRDLAARRKTLKLWDGKCGGTVYEAVDREAPIGEAAGLKSLESVRERRKFVGEGRLGNLAWTELSGQ